MVRNRFLIPIALLLGLTLVFAGCKEDSDPKEYDRGALTAQVGDRIIRPAYNSLADAVELLRTDCNSFRQNPDLTHHAALADQSMATWLIWKACSPFEFGPAATVSLRSILNTFPSDTLQIHANFTSGSYDLNQAANLDARGFPALDFLLHGLAATDAEILGRYNNAADSANLFGYLAAVVNDIHAHCTSVANQWNGSYIATFKESLGTDVGSSTSFLVNELNRNLEIIKTASLGIPLGKQTFGTPLPEKVEALYSQESKALMQAELNGLEVIFEGQAAGASEGYGLREALDAVEAQHNGGNLGDAIHTQFGVAKAALAALPIPLSDAVVNNRAPVEAAYTEIQKLVVLLKTDMASSLSILITYADNDGD